MAEALEIGATFGAYRIERKLGEGGMGEVYLAEDTRLLRKIALKILPADVATKGDRMQRFEQEARAASALNHPDILTIYEIGELDDMRFIATEFVDGETLRDRLQRRLLELEETLEYSIQTASALSAAHEAGIVHRDIKPENLMIRRDGLVKVLDFGLAKLGTAPAEIDSEGETRAQVKTEPGVIMGTVRYMSPEQARGKTLDSRSDIWSLGCVIYEMACGRPPFDGETTADLIAEIVKVHPTPLTTRDAAIPDRLDEIVSKCLEKDREERYQVVKDLAIDLRRLKRKIDLRSDMERSSTPEGNELTRSGMIERTQSVTGGSTISIPPASTVTSVHALSGTIRTHKSFSAIAGVIVLAVLGALAYLGYRVWTTPAPTIAGRTMKITRLTTDGTAGAVSISKDGKYVVHAAGIADKRGLWIRQTSAESAQEIVPSADGFFIGTTFTPDNDRVYYAWRGRGEASATLFSIPTLGGTPVRIADNVNGPVTFSPDGKQIAFVRNEFELVVANADGGAEKVIQKVNGATTYFPNEGGAWSPDGALIAVGKGELTDGRFRMTIVGIAPDGSAEKPLTTTSWERGVSRIVWLNDGSGLVANVFEKTGLTQVWYIPVPTGDARRITNDLKGYGTFSLGVTGDGSAIATVDEERNNSAWSAVIGDDEGTAKQLNTGKYDADDLAIAPDGRIVFVRRTGDTPDIWIMNADGSSQKRLTNDDKWKGGVQVTPDGRYIVFARFGEDDAGAIWKMGLDGSDPVRITTAGGAGDGNPHVSPDGKWVVFNSWRTGRWLPFRVGIDGGEEVQLYNGSSGVAGPISPDSAYVLCGTIDNQTRTSTFKVELIPLVPGGPIKPVSIEPNFPFEDATWIGDQLIVQKRVPGNVYSVSMSTGQEKQLTKFKSLSIFPMAASADGKRFVLSRGTITNDVILIKDFK